MTADPFAFYLGSACLFYAGMATLEDRWSDERTSRAWIQGDLHAENVGTYLDGAGRIVVDGGQDLTEPAEIEPVLTQLGRATAKLHCVGDADSDHTLVPFQTEEAIGAMIGGRRAEFIADLVDFAHAHAARTRDDHRLFVDAFRAGQIPG